MRQPCAPTWRRPPRSPRHSVTWIASALCSRPSARAGARTSGLCIRYTCRREAVTQLRADGGLRAAFSAVLGEPVPGSSLTPGDIAYVVDPGTGTQAVGLVLPDCVAVKVRRTVARLPRAFCHEGWTWDRP